jgi:hypothetical protein
MALDPVIEGLGGGTEIVGGLWTLLISWAALRSGGLPRSLNNAGLVVGMAGILSAVPALGEAAVMVLGLGQIVWFAWLGLAMLRSGPGAAVEEPGAFVLRQRTTA